MDYRLSILDKPISGVDAAALVHDMEYMRDNSRYHADVHMYQNLRKEYPHLPMVAVASALTFATDTLINGDKRTSNNKDKYKHYSKIARKIMNSTSYQSTFDD